MSTSTSAAPAILAIFLAVALSLVGGPSARAQLFDSDPPPASAQHLSTEDALKKAIDWAKFGKNPTADYAVDTAIGVISVGYPPAGAALAIAWGFIKAMGGGSDPVGDALRALSSRLDELDKRLSALQVQVAQIQNDQLRLTNEVRMRELLNRRDEVKRLTFLLRQMPTDQKAKEQIVYDVMTLAARYIPDAGPDAALWYWSDLRITTNQSLQYQPGEMLRPEFKVAPTFEYYASTLVLLMSAIEYEVGANDQLAVKKYGHELLRHAAFLSVRPFWREFGNFPAIFSPPESFPGNTAGTLPEMLMTRNTCYVQPSGKYPTNRTCGSFYICDDIMRRTRTTHPGPDYPVADNNQLCTLPARQRRQVSAQQFTALAAQYQKSPVYGTNALQAFQQWSERDRPTPIEDDLEGAYGLGAMTELADKLASLARYGTTREQYIGQFDMTFYTQQYLYAVRANGELLWFGHLIGVDKNPPKTPVVAGQRASSSVLQAGDLAGATGAQGHASQGPASALSKAGAIQSGGTDKVAGAGSPAASPGATPARRLGVSAIDKLDLPPAPKVIHKLSEPKLVGSGWQGFVQVIPAGRPGFYGLGADNQLRWYRHDGYQDGTARWKGPVNANPAALTAPKSAPSGPGSPGGAAKPSPGIDPKIAGPPSATARMGAGSANRDLSVASPRLSQIVGPGVNWLAFKRIVPAGDGVLYGISADGTLYWYHHQDYTDPLPQPKWSGPVAVSSGWQNAVHAFSTGEGVIYAVQPNGDLMWYRHKGYLTGQESWDAPKKVGTGWAAFRRVFSPGAGVVYALQPDGALLWYQHDGYQDGSARWQGPTRIAASWGDFVQVFPLMWGTPQAPVIR